MFVTHGTPVLVSSSCFIVRGEVMMYMTKRYTLIEFIVTIAIICVLMAIFISACNASKEVKMEDKWNEVKVLRQTKVKGKYGTFYCTKLELEGHDYFLVSGSRGYSGVKPVHCVDCRKCKGELE